MTPSLFNPNAEDAFDSFIGTAIRRADELWELDGETAFRRHNPESVTSPAGRRVSGTPPGAGAFPIGFAEKRHASHSRPETTIGQVQNWWCQSAVSF